MKKLISLLLVLAICLSFSVLAFADSSPAPEDEGGEASASTGDSTRAEETKWYYRITEDGLFQKRLWSLTYGYWKTDWITIGHAL